MDENALKLLNRRVELFRAAPRTKLVRNLPRLALSEFWRAFHGATGKYHFADITTFWGQKMRVVLPEGVSVSLYRYGFFEEELTAIFLKLIRPGMTVFDIGAHFGYFSLLASALVGDNGKVFSFEPTPSTHGVLSHNLRSKKNVVVTHAAVFSSAGEMTFQDFGVANSAFNTLAGGKLTGWQREGFKSTECKVKTIALDPFFTEIGRIPDFIKMDAENAELPILEGMQNTLAGERRPIITVEVGDAPDEKDSSKRPVTFLVERGYKVYEFDRASKTLNEREVRSSYRYDNLLMVPCERAGELNL